MKTVKYGDWKIAVDIEKTKEFYSNYVINDTQANRNFAEYCKNLLRKRRAFSILLELQPNIAIYNILE